MQHGDAKLCKLSPKYNCNASPTVPHAYISGMKSIADTSGMNDTTPARRSTDPCRVRMIAQKPGSVLSQAITLLRIVAVVLPFYLKFKLGLWLHRRRGSVRDE
jgi:hypothetical protein